MGLLSRRKGVLAWLVVASLASALAFSLALPLVIMRFTDEGVMAQNLQALGYYSALALAIVVVNFAAGYLIQVNRYRLRNAVVEEISLRSFRQFFTIPFKTILQKDSGYFIARIYDEIPKSVGPFIQLVIELAVTGLSLVASFGVLLYLSWRVTLLVLIGVPLFHFVSGRLLGRIRQYAKEASESEAMAKGLLQRMVEAHKVVNLFNLHNTAWTLYGGALKRLLGAFYDNARSSVVYTTLGTAFVFGSSILVLFYSGYEVVQGRLTMGGLVAISNIYGRLLGYVQTVVQGLPALQSSLANFDRLFEFLSLGAGQEDAIEAGDRIAVRDIGFAYQAQEVFKGLSLAIDKGERLLIVGRNGSGKTTLVHVLAGILQPTSGKAQTFGVKGASAAFFPPSFIPGDVASNVGFDDLSDEKKELYNRLAEAFEIREQLGEDPHSLSAGQQQKVSILRALLKEADLYIFDEPFSNVDQRTKDRIFEAILEVTRGKCLVLVMHCDEQFHSEFDRVIDLDQHEPALVESLPQASQTPG